MKRSWKYTRKKRR